MTGAGVLQTPRPVSRSEGLREHHRTVLVVADDDVLRRAVGDALAHGAMQTVDVIHADRVMATLEAARPDAVVMALLAPHVLGLDVVRLIRQSSDIPIVLLAGSIETDELVMALEMGADDFLFTPFAPRELVARLRAVLRRSSPSTVSERLVYGELGIDSAAREVTLSGSKISFTAKEFDLLAFLANNPRRVFTREQLLQRVWGSRSDWQDPATVTEHVRRIRRKIELNSRAPRWIATVHSAGYRFEPWTDLSH